MAAIVPELLVPSADQAQIRLVDQGGDLKAAPFSPGQVSVLPDGAVRRRPAARIALERKSHPGNSLQHLRNLAHTTWP